MNRRDNSDTHGPAWAYRIYDSSDRLIYVGATLDLTSRLETHVKSSWWGSQIARVEMSLHATKGEARRVEVATIAQERPRWNIRHRWATRDTWTLADYDDYLTTLVRNNSTDSAHIANAAAQRARLFGAEVAA